MRKQASFLLISIVVIVACFACSGDCSDTATPDTFKSIGTQQLAGTESTSSTALNAPRFPTFTVKPTYSDVVVATVATDLMGEGTSRDLCMNIYKPEGRMDPTPAVIYVHGGK